MCNLGLLQGDYDLVITDYTRAKSLFGDTEVAVFKKGDNPVTRTNCSAINSFEAKLYSLCVRSVPILFCIQSHHFENNIIIV